MYDDDDERTDDDDAYEIVTIPSSLYSTVVTCSSDVRRGEGSESEYVQPDFIPAGTESVATAAPTYDVFDDSDGESVDEPQQRQAEFAAPVFMQEHPYPFVEWGFTPNPTNPEKMYQVEETLRPWISQLQSIYPTGLRLVLMPNISRPSQYAAPHGFVAIFDPQAVVHPLLIDRWFGLGTTAMYLDIEEIEARGQQEIRAALRSAARKHGLTGEGSLLGLYRKTCIVNGQIAVRYALIITAVLERTAADFVKYAEEAYNKKVSVLDAFLLGDNLKKIQEMTSAAKTMRRNILVDAANGLGKIRSLEEAMFSDTAYHAFAYDQKNCRVTYTSNASPCGNNSSNTSFFRHLSPATGYIEFLGGSRTWFGVPDAMWCFPTTMRLAGKTGPMSAKPIAPFIVNVEDDTDTPAQAAQYPEKYVERSMEERSLEEALGRMYSHTEAHWVPVSVVMPKPNMTDAFNLSNLANLLSL